jgi:glycine/D-amino acid oxidase-like deaminating enzyme
MDNGDIRKAKGKTSTRKKGVKFDKIIVACASDCSSIIGNLDWGLNTEVYPIKGYTFNGNSSGRGSKLTTGTNFIERGIYLRPMDSDGDTDDNRALIGGLFQVSGDHERNTTDPVTEIPRDGNNKVKADIFKHFTDTSVIGEDIIRDILTPLKTGEISDGDEVWYEYRPVSTSSLPIVRHYKNGKGKITLSLLTGLGANGYSHCWYAADKLIKEIIADDELHDVKS